MRKSITTLALTLFALLSATSFLAACHTTAGAGQDISQTGKAIERGAERNTP